MQISTFLPFLVSTASAMVLGTVAMAEPITIYSPQGGERAEWIAAQAEAAGHEVSILNAGGGELFDRLLAEKNNPQADVVFGLVDTSMALLATEGLFQPYTPVWAEGLPEQYSDPDGLVWKFWQTPIVLGFNTERMTAAEAPTSWLDLTEDRYAGQYVIGSTSWQTTRVYLAGILARFLDENGEVTDEGWDFMRDLYANAIIVNDGDAQTQAFASGDAAITLNWFGGAFRLADAADFTVQLVDTEGGTPVIAEGVAIMEGTDQLDQARAFVDWFGSPEFMAAYATQFGQIPAHPQAIAMSPEKLQKNATLVTAQTIDWTAIAPKLDGWLQTIELEIR